MNNDPRFHYNAHAVALEGKVNHPFQQDIDVQAPTFVSPNGGYGTAKADPYNLRDIVSHNGARSRAEAGQKPNTTNHYAIVHAELQGFNISDVLTADSVVARLSVTHSPDQEEPFISPKGSRIENLRILGHEITLIPLADTYHSNGTMSDLRKHFADNKDYRQTFYAHGFIGSANDVPDDKHKFFRWLLHKKKDELPEFRGHTIVPLFKIVDPNVAGIQVHGSVISVHNFGRIHVGELYVSPEERRVTMLRAKLGSPQDASIVAGGGGGGMGQTDP
ncbi:MAG: hypothetical protein JO323_26120 [Acidobacteriia bacterium]|nr:hypothetical protein [Terriglobia bacterium]